MITLEVKDGTVTALLINEETGVLDSTVILPFKMEDGHMPTFTPTEPGKGIMSWFDVDFNRTRTAILREHCGGILIDNLN